ncbi:MAG: RloB family protein [Peptococcaceae bacterium]|jgi:hypothetical protein|nr:RloB family protein [Peptococcaceae bacterium]
MAKGELRKRGVRRRQLKPVVLIVTEGSQTEPKYFASSLFGVRPKPHQFLICRLHKISSQKIIDPARMGTGFMLSINRKARQVKHFKQ